MGLDMYLNGNKWFFPDHTNPDATLTEDGFEVRKMILELGYWRKHPNLHGFIVQTFAKGVDDCQEIELAADDIDTIIQAVKERKLPFTEGFFFGASRDSAEEVERDVKIFEAAKAWLKAPSGRSNYRSLSYRASW